MNKLNPKFHTSSSPYAMLGGLLSMLVTLVIAYYPPADIATGATIVNACVFYLGAVVRSMFPESATAQPTGSSSPMTMNPTLATDDRDHDRTQPVPQSQT